MYVIINQLSSNYILILMLVTLEMNIFSKHNSAPPPPWGFVHHHFSSFDWGCYFFLIDFIEFFTY